jgi:5-oxoprolinase (ATP-hydrolysing)
VGTHADPVMLEIFNNLFMSIAEQMGVTLQNTAYSVNIKERLDFSCAVFDATGRSSPTPPHAGASRLHGPLGGIDHPQQPGDPPRRRVRDQRALQRRHAPARHHDLHPGLRRCGREVLFWVASRGHHADVGGTAPGSMSPNARTIEEEGVYIDNFQLVARDASARPSSWRS